MAAADCSPARVERLEKWTAYLLACEVVHEEALLGRASTRELEKANRRQAWMLKVARRF